MPSFLPCVATLLVAVALSACSGSGDSSTTPNAQADNPGIETTPALASRLLMQATFGPTSAEIARVQELGMAAWVDEQFTRQGPSHLDYVRAHSNSSRRETRHEIWWREALTGDDQLRQRVAFALSEIFVVSDISYTLGNAQYGISHYYDTLSSHAFGNYRELLEAVTLSPVMGLYLSMLQNSRADEATNTRPDENFAREVMQLFSIGLVRLNPDGTPVLSNGQVIPAYTQTDVENYARVFTGWNYADAGTWNRLFASGPDRLSPMAPFPGYHDDQPKTLIDGSVTPAGASAEQDLALALDSIANHPNVGPFIGKQLIQRLVTSNPSSAYVARVSAVFDNNGQGERGDLQAVVRAILLDPEATNPPDSSRAGKLREPLLRITHLWRAFNVQPGTYGNGEYNLLTPYAVNIHRTTGQAPMRSSSVFNFFHPQYSPLGPVQAAGMVAPEAEINTDNNILSTTSYLNSLTQRFYADGDHGVSYIDLSQETALAANPASLLEHLDLLLMASTMSTEMHNILLEHLNALPDTPEGHSQRARDAISLIMASPAYLVQR